LPAVLVVAATVLFANFLLRPGPPRTIVMTAGGEGGAYLAFAERYRELLAREGIRLRVLPSNGSLENLERLKDPDPRRRSEYLERLSWIDRQQDNVRPPLSIAQERYAFRLHIENVQKRILNIGETGSGRIDTTQR